jgi:hypothetical protein
MSVWAVVWCGFYYFELLYLKDYQQKEKKASYLRILDVIKRFQENNPDNIDLILKKNYSIISGIHGLTIEF